MSSGERSPVSPTKADESPKNTIRVIKTNDSEKTVVEVKVAGETAGKVTVFGGDGIKHKTVAAEKMDEPNKADDEKTETEKADEEKNAPEKANDTEAAGDDKINGPEAADNEKNEPEKSIEPLTQEEVDKIVARYGKMDEKNKKKFLDFFWSVDTFGFGAFTVHQLAYRLRSSGRLLTDKQIAKIFSDLDSNNDMIVTLDEFLEEMSKEKPVLHRSEEEWQALFKRADRNNDGFVCRKDLMEMLDEAGVKVTTPELNDFMRRDSSGNAERLNFHEFRRAMQSNRQTFTIY